MAETFKRFLNTRNRLFFITETTDNGGWLYPFESKSDIIALKEMQTTVKHSALDVDTYRIGKDKFNEVESVKGPNELTVSEDFKLPGILNSTSVNDILLWKKMFDYNTQASFGMTFTGEDSATIDNADAISKYSALVFDLNGTNYTVFVIDKTGSDIGFYPSVTNSLETVTCVALKYFTPKITIERQKGLNVIECINNVKNRNVNCIPYKFELDFNRGEKSSLTFNLLSRGLYTFGNAVLNNDYEDDDVEFEVSKNVIYIGNMTLPLIDNADYTIFKSLGDYFNIFDKTTLELKETILVKDFTLNENGSCTLTSITRAQKGTTAQSISENDIIAPYIPVIEGSDYTGYDVIGLYGNVYAMCGENINNIQFNKLKFSVNEKIVDIESFSYDKLTDYTDGDIREVSLEIDLIGYYENIKEFIDSLYYDEKMLFITIGKMYGYRLGIVLPRTTFEVPSFNPEAGKLVNLQLKSRNIMGTIDGYGNDSFKIYWF